MAVRIISISRRISGCKPFHLWNNFHSLSFRRTHTTIRGSSIEISPEVKSALNSGHPVVALESTILTHGLTYPENIETAQKVEDVIRKNGAVPATVGILKGKLCVGLTLEQIEFLSNQKSNVVKASRRDLAYVMSQGLNGGTTVSATMIAAHTAGIEIFVTGGIGGVHRGAEEMDAAPQQQRYIRQRGTLHRTPFQHKFCVKPYVPRESRRDPSNRMDVSADLRELGRTPVTVVCAGVKSILDIGKTLEYLETEGVCVATYGRSSEFPAFFSSKSGFHSPHQVDTLEVASHLINTHMNLNLNTGMIVAVPIPEEDAVDNSLVEEAVNIALKNAKSAGVNGKSITPFLLKKVNELLVGVTQTADISLIQNNAIIGSRIACSLSLLKNSGSNRQPSSPNPRRTRNFDSRRAGSQTELTAPSPNIAKTMKTENPQVVVVGGVNYDLTSVFSIDDNMVEANGSTYPGHLRQSFGGVGRNLSDCLSRLDVPSLFISAVGNDSIGDMFRRKYKHMDLSGVETVREHPTASYSAVLYSSEELMLGTGDFEIHADISPELISRYEDQMRGARLVCMDGNIPPTSMTFMTDFCSKHNIPVWFEPTDRHHVQKPFMSDAWKHLTYTSPNLSELEQLVDHMRQMPDCRQTPIQRETVRRLKSVSIQSADGNIGTSLDAMLEGCVQMCKLITNFIPNVLVTLGKHSVLWATKSKPRSDGATGYFAAVHFTANWIGHPDLKFCSVSGTGDCLAASMITGLIDGVPADEAIGRGFMAAMLSLQSHEAVPDTISHDAFDPGNIRQRIHVNRTVLVPGQRPTSYMN